MLNYKCKIYIYLKIKKLKNKFGMRAVKSVLVMAGELKRREPELSEDTVLIRAMRDSNVPKFLNDDLPLFHALV